jgi:hypothetical protein
MNGWAPDWLPRTLLVILLLLAIAVLVMMLLLAIDLWSFWHEFAETGGGD